jgi:hypothetical protein
MPAWRRLKLGLVKINEVRLHNLRLLLQRCEHELGKPRGAMALLARRTGVPQPLLSQILAGRSNAADGTPRTIGDKVARMLEQGMMRADGWMDVDHSEARTVEEADLLDQIRRLSPEHRQTVASLVRALAGAAQPDPT